MMINRDSIERASEHIHGTFNEKSGDERRLHCQIKHNLICNPDTKYHFYFNKPITFFGVPSKSVRIQDYRNCFIEYVMRRCFVDESEAIELMNMVDTPVRTNALKLDIAKTDNHNVLISGLESNRWLHYKVPNDHKHMADFAKTVFNDMVKEMEIRKIAEFIELNHCVDIVYGVGSKQSIEQAMIINAFVSVD